VSFLNLWRKVGGFDSGLLTTIQFGARATMILIQEAIWKQRISVSIYFSGIPKAIWGEEPPVDSNEGAVSSSSSDVRMPLELWDMEGF
jgi:hypothetical protein